jgi:hypothetical protein
MTKIVNVYSDYPFQVDIRTPNAKGELAVPTLGALTGIVMRLAATRSGTALAPAVGNLPATERAQQAGRFVVLVDTALLVTYVLPLGLGVEFFAIWSRAGDMDREAVRYLVGDGNVVG